MMIDTSVWLSFVVARIVIGRGRVQSPSFVPFSMLLLGRLPTDLACCVHSCQTEEVVTKTYDDIRPGAMGIMHG